MRPPGTSAARLRRRSRRSMRRSVAWGSVISSERHLGDLSGGQRQRVFVAQGLAQDHDILLLDEPLTGLDITSAQAIDDVIHDENTRGCTIVMTTHDLAEAQVANHVVLLSRPGRGLGAAGGGPQRREPDRGLRAEAPPCGGERDVHRRPGTPAGARPACASGSIDLASPAGALFAGSGLVDLQGAAVVVMPVELRDRLGSPRRWASRRNRNHESARSPGR